MSAHPRLCHSPLNLYLPAPVFNPLFFMNVSGQCTYVLPYLDRDSRFECSEEVFYRRLLIINVTHHFVFVLGFCFLFSCFFHTRVGVMLFWEKYKKKKNLTEDQGSTFSLVQININRYINRYKYILYILPIFVQFCILHSCKVCF